MRKERITQRAAQSAWDAIRESITLAPLHGSGTPLPAIDLGEIFAGRKSMTARAVVAAIRARLDEAIPT